MIKVGLTGNIGSGKSTVLKEFEKLGVYVYDTDSAAKRILHKNVVMGYLDEKYGTKVVHFDKFAADKIDKKALAKIIFNNVEERKALEKIVHPLVRKDFIAWCEGVEKMYDVPYVIMESAILFENGFDIFMDKIITVVCDEKIAIERTIKRDNTTEEKVRERLDNQMSQIDKAFRSDFIIMNNNQDLPKQVKQIDEELSAI